LRIIVTGHKGQLGSAVVRVLADHEILGLDLPEWDITDRAQVKKTVNDFQPDAVIHCAALTNVDYCANNPHEAVRINGVGTYNIAVAARDVGATILAISTNEVFDGTADRPYQEYDQRNPINPYGYSKYVGEQVIERYAPDHMIVRTAWLYASGGTNFIHKVVARARDGQPLRVVTDEIASPTYASDLAEAVASLLAKRQPGIYHMVNAGAASRYDFARKALDLIGLADVAIEPITSDAFERASTPPPYAPLDNIFGAAIGVTMRPWEDALEAYIQSEFGDAAS
jgi:dTDP-4-dehydrorhamnose reductase